MTSLFGRAAAGMLAGAAGTVAMDLVLYRRSHQDGDGESFAEWDVDTSSTSFEEASAPGKVGERAADVAGIDVPEEAAGTTTNVVHWLTGVGYGIAHGLFQHDRGVIRGGLVTGLGAFANSYAALGAMGIYQPIWEYDRDTLMKDLTAHLAFGFATAIAYGVLAPGDDADG